MRPEDAVPDVPLPGPRAVTDSGYAVLATSGDGIGASGAAGERCVLEVAVHVEPDTEVAVGDARGSRRSPWCSPRSRGRRPSGPVARRRCRVRGVGCGKGEHDAVGAGAVELIGVERDVETLGGGQARLIEDRADLAFPPLLVRRSAPFPDVSGGDAQFGIDVVADHRTRGQAGVVGPARSGRAGPTTGRSASSCSRTSR